MKQLAEEYAHENPELAAFLMPSAGEKNDYLINLSLSGAIELGAGVGLDLGLSISLKPIIDFFSPEKEVTPIPMDGIILTGCGTVLIG